MKRIWTAIALMILALFSSVAEFYTVSYCYEHYTEALDNAEEYISQKEFNKATDLLTNTQQEWHKTEKLLDIFLSHETVDDVTENISELYGYAIAEDKAQFQSVCDKTKRQLLRLKQSELPNLENIM